MAKGRKTCPNCDKETGARRLLCECGYNFATKNMREAPAIVKEHKALTKGRGRKTCPQCKKIIGVRTHQCQCGFDFTTLQPKEEKVNPYWNEIEDIPYISSPKLSPMEHAKRILSYEEKRARLLLQTVKSLKCWSHVDWDIVEQELAVI